MYFIPLPGYVLGSCAHRSNNRFRSDTVFKSLQNPKEGEDDCTRARLCQKHRHYFFLSHLYFPASGQAVVTGVVPSPPPVLVFNFIAHRVQQSHYSSIVHRVLLSHALVLSGSQFVHKKKSQRIYTSIQSVGLDLTELIYIGLDDNLIRHRGGRCIVV